VDIPQESLLPTTHVVSRCRLGARPYAATPARNPPGRDTLTRHPSPTPSTIHTGQPRLVRGRPAAPQQVKQHPAAPQPGRPPWPCRPGWARRQEHLTQPRSPRRMKATRLPVSQTATTHWPRALGPPRPQPADSVNPRTCTPRQWPRTLRQRRRPHCHQPAHPQPRPHRDIDEAQLQRFATPRRNGQGSSPPRNYIGVVSGHNAIPPHLRYMRRTAQMPQQN